MITTKAFWKGAFERAIKTFAQAFVAVLTLTTGAEMLPSVGVLGVPWVDALSVALMATVLSVLTSIGNAEFTAGAPAPREQDVVVREVEHSFEPSRPEVEDDMDPALLR